MRYKYKHDLYGQIGGNICTHALQALLLRFDGFCWNVEKPPATIRARPALISRLTFPSSSIWQCVCMRCAITAGFLRKSETREGSLVISVWPHVRFQIFILIKILFDDVLI